MDSSANCFTLPKGYFKGHPSTVPLHHRTRLHLESDRARKLWYTNTPRQVTTWSGLRRWHYHVLLDSDSERADDHITCLQENAGYVGLITNFKKTRALYFNCEPTTLVVLEEEVAPVEDLWYLRSMISSLEDLECSRSMARSVFWKPETVWRSQSLNLETELGLFDSLVLSVMLYGAEWPISAQMTGVKRLDKLHNTTVLSSVFRNELIPAVHW